MAIIQAGRQFTAEQLQADAGSVAAMVRDAVQRADNLRAQLESWPDADLITLGLSQEEVNAMKGFYVGDMPAIRDLLKASTWMKQLLGTGL